MKVKKTRKGNYKLTASADEAKYLLHLIGPTTGAQDNAAGVPADTGWGIYDALYDAVHS